MTLQVLSNLGSQELIKSLNETNLSIKLTSQNNKDVPFKMSTRDKTKNTILVNLQLNLSITSNNTEIDEIEKKAEEQFGSNRNGLARKTVIYLSHRYSGKSLKELGERFCMSQSGVSQASRRFERVMTADGKLNEIMDNMRQGLGLSNVQT